MSVAFFDMGHFTGLRQHSLTCALTRASQSLYILCCLACLQRLEVSSPYMHLETLHAHPNCKDTPVTQHTCGSIYIDPVACLTMVHICEASLACRQLANKKSNAGLLVQRGEEEDRIWVRCYLLLWWPFCHYIYGPSPCFSLQLSSAT